LTADEQVKAENLADVLVGQREPAAVWRLQFTRARRVVAASGLH